MIVKKVKYTSFVKTKAQRIGDLVDYIRNPQQKNAHEKVAFSGSRNFIWETHHAQKMEMIALATENTRSKMPVAHWIFSWQEGEQPTAEQVEEVVDIFLKEMGLEGHQTIFAMHQDKANYHVHIAVNRVNEETGKAVLPHNGWDIEAGHRIIAQIEHKQGWASTDNARYQVLENGELVRRRPTHRTTVNPKPKACDFERIFSNGGGEKSAQRIAPFWCNPWLWRHRESGNVARIAYRLGTSGLAPMFFLIKKGSGAIVFVPSSADPIAVKASSIHRAFRMGKLSKKLGKYEGGNYETEVKKVPPEPVSTVNMVEWKAYQEQRQAPKRIHPIKQRNQQIAELKAHIKQKRTNAFEVLKVHDPIIFRIASRLLQIEQIDELEAIHEAYKQQPKVDCSKPSFEKWLRLQGLHMEAEQWRHRRLVEKAKQAEKAHTSAQQPAPSQATPQNTSTEAKAFERYAHAVNASRYRVTSIKIDYFGQGDGNKKAFILDKKDGASKGFTAEEMLQRIPQMQRMQARRENIYYTPLSDDKHHILIDDMTAESVAKLRKDGFVPAVILESSPKNYQCILTIPKVQSPFDREASNRLTEQLNREYGDKKLSGCIHPHRAPGFGNMKPKYQNTDGSYPRVKLLFAEKQECDYGSRAYLTARAIAKKYEEQERERKAQSQHVAQRLPQTSATTAYFNHYDDMRQHMTIEDFSRLDAMIAVPMRATGHSLQAVMDVIQECAPTIRMEGCTKEGRNWQKYAERTAAYAFGVAGDLALQRLNHTSENWNSLNFQKNILANVYSRLN